MLSSLKDLRNPIIQYKYQFGVESSRIRYNNETVSEDKEENGCSTISLYCLAYLGKERGVGQGFLAPPVFGRLLLREPHLLAPSRHKLSLPMSQK